MSEEYITEHCGILDKLIPGDVVLVDREFNISDSVDILPILKVGPPPPSPPLQKYELVQLLKIFQPFSMYKLHPPIHIQTKSPIPCEL